MMMKPLLVSVLVGLLVVVPVASFVLLGHLAPSTQLLQGEPIAPGLKFSPTRETTLMPAAASSAGAAGSGTPDQKGGFVRVIGTKFAEADCSEFIPQGWNALSTKLSEPNSSQFDLSCLKL
jgi:hypothetical protein